MSVSEQIFLIAAFLAAAFIGCGMGALGASLHRLVREFLRKRRAKHDAVIGRDPYDDEIASACFYFDHAYHVLNERERASLRWYARQWHYCWRKVQEDADSKAKRKIG